MLSTKLPVSDVRTNLIDAAESRDLYLSPDDLTFILDKGYDAMSSWSFHDYSDFVHDIQSEGNIRYVLREYDLLDYPGDIDEALDDLDTHKVISWIADHQDLYSDFCFRFDYHYDEDTGEQTNIPTKDDIYDWLADHDMAWDDFCNHFNLM